MAKQQGTVYNLVHQPTPIQVVDALYSREASSRNMRVLMATVNGVIWFDVKMVSASPSGINGTVKVIGRTGSIPFGAVGVGIVQDREVVLICYDGAQPGPRFRPTIQFEDASGLPEPAPLSE